MATLEQIDEKLDRVENMVIEVKVVLLGKGSDKGLVGEVREHQKQIKRNTIILAAIIGSGMFGGGIAGLVQLLNGS